MTTEIQNFFSHFWTRPTLKAADEGQAQISALHLIEAREDPPTPMPKDTVLDVLKVLGSKESNTQHDVKSHPILIHCRAEKKSSGLVFIIGAYNNLQLQGHTLKTFQESSGIIIA
ncbi:hypothetical protein YC2023_093428 [Brassica napus]